MLSSNCSKIEQCWDWKVYKKHYLFYAVYAKNCAHMHSLHALYCYIVVWHWSILSISFIPYWSDPQVPVKQTWSILWVNKRLVCQKQVSMAEASNYIPHYLWHNIPNCMKEVTWLKLCLGTMGTGQLLWSGCLSSCRLFLYKQHAIKSW